MSNDDRQPGRGSSGPTDVPGEHAEPSKPASGGRIGGVFLVITGLVIVIGGAMAIESLSPERINQNPVTAFVMFVQWLFFIAVLLGGATCLVIGASLLLGRGSGTAGVVRLCFRLVVSVGLGIVGLVILAVGIYAFVDFQGGLHIFSSLGLIFGAAGGFLAYRAIRRAMAAWTQLRDHWAERKRLATDPGQ